MNSYVTDFSLEYLLFTSLFNFKLVAVGGKVMQLVVFTSLFNFEVVAVAGKCNATRITHIII